MDFNIETQFQKLQDIVLNKVDTFRFFTGASRYLGPVRPSSIISFSLDVTRMNALVLAEAVPAYYFPPEYASMTHDAVIVFLDEKFELNSYDPAGKDLHQVNLLIGDPKCPYDGTVDEAKAIFANHNTVLEILYRQENAPDDGK